MSGELFEGKRFGYRVTPVDSVIAKKICIEVCGTDKGLTASDAQIVAAQSYAKDHPANATFEDTLREIIKAAVRKSALSAELSRRLQNAWQDVKG